LETEVIYFASIESMN